MIDYLNNFNIEEKKDDYFKIFDYLPYAFEELDELELETIEEENDDAFAFDNNKKNTNYNYNNNDDAFNSKYDMDVD